MLECGYIGRSDKMVGFLLENPEIKLNHIICDGEPSDKLKKVIDENNIPYDVATNKKELALIVNNNQESLYLMYVCGIIIPEEVIQKAKIYNFHPGSLENNRGATPIIKSILRGDYYSIMNVFEIDGGIDSGRLITNRLVRIEQSDNSKTLSEKMENTIPDLLKDIVSNDGKDESIYCKKVCADDYIIDLEKHSLEDVEKIIKSQSIYNGAVYNDSRMTDINVLNYDWNVVDENDDEICFEITSKVKIKKSGFYSDKVDLWHNRPNGY